MISEMSKETGPGLFYILSRPKPGNEDEYHEWYDSEHGPLRLTTDFILNGYRYRSLEVHPQVFLATYDISRLNGFDESQYTNLRANRSARESQVIEDKLALLDRRFFKSISTRGSSSGPAPVMMAVIFVVKDQYVDELHRWYEEEHTDDLSKIPGWRRSRRFKLVEADDMKEGYTELLAIHEFDKDNGIGGPEHEVAKSKPWRTRVVGLVESRNNRLFEFFHEFKASDYRSPPVETFDKASEVLDWEAQYRVEGSKTGPAVVFLNSLLTNHHIWDEVVSKLTRFYPGYRLILYNTRGYSADSGRDITIDALTDDLASLLNVLGVEKCFAVIGVSLGGVTALNFAARYPSRLDHYVACDCNAISTEANTKAWKARQALAAQSWEELAEQTVARWFTSKSVHAQSEGLSKVKDMILSADRDGFVRCVNALCNFDLSNKIRNIAVPGLALVGANDGTLPETMERFSKTIPDCKFATIPNSGHLPMVEDGAAFVEALRPIFETRRENR